MAKGLEKHQERLAQLSAFGKDLTRRAGACCELCSASGVALRVYEVAPVPVEPEFERCLYLCDACRSELEHPARLDANHWRCACEAIWSEVPAAQVMAARILDQIGRKELWAREALENASLDEEVEEWVRQARL